MRRQGGSQTHPQDGLHLRYGCCILLVFLFLPVEDVKALEEHFLNIFLILDLVVELSVLPEAVNGEQFGLPVVVAKHSDERNDASIFEVRFILLTSDAFAYRIHQVIRPPTAQQRLD